MYIQKKSLSISISLQRCTIKHKNTTNFSPTIMFTTITNLLFPGVPTHTVVAQELTQYLRNKTIRPAVTTKQQLRVRSIKYLDSVQAGCLYHKHPIIEKAIWEAKYNNQPGLLPMLSMLLRTTAIPSNALVTAVPLHWFRHWNRGFNQAELLLNTMAEYSSNTVDPTVLKRIKPTGHQARRNRSQRLIAVQTAFKATKKIKQPVYILDDICTTGATLDACARALKANGAPSVHGVVLAQS